MRADRLVSILLKLQARGRMTAAALAAELEVSERTIYRDLAGLSAAGVPVYGERGEGGCYRLVEGYRTNLTGLTAGEAEGLLLTGAAGPLTELGLGALLAATRLKLLAAVPAGLRPLATRAEERFHLDPAGWAHQAPRDRGRLQSVAGAIWRDHRLSVTYQRGDGRIVRRRLDPLGLVHKTGTWYLVAGHEGQTRVYRVDRLLRADELDAAARRPEGFDLPAFWARWEAEYAASLPTYRVRVRLGPLAQRFIGTLGAVAPRAATEEGVDADGWARRVLVFDNRAVARAALLAFGGEVEVLAPAELRDELVASARAVIERHRTSAEC